MKPNLDSTQWIALAREILSFQEHHAWPLRLDLLMQRSSNEKGYSESEILELLHQIESQPSVLSEWQKIPGPEVEKEEGKEPPPPSALDRVRIYGIQRTRCFLVGSLVRNRPMSEDLENARKTKKDENFMSSPLRSWQGLSKVFEDHGVDLELKLEVSTVLDLFYDWMTSGSKKAEHSRTKRWLESRFDLWAKLWKQLQLESKKGQSLPVQMIIRTQILLDLGRATLLAHSDTCISLWKNSEKQNEPHAFLFLQESQRFGFCSAQLACLWAQTLGHLASIGTPLRLLVRPWRSEHSQVKKTHALAARYLEKWMVGVTQ